MVVRLGRLARNPRFSVAGFHRGPQSSDPQTSGFCCSGVVAVLRRVAESVPLLVVLDDFHWADGQSVAL